MQSERIRFPAARVNMAKTLFGGLAMNVKNVKWEPQWYELDQSIVVGDEDLAPL